MVDTDKDNEAKSAQPMVFVSYTNRWDHYSGEKRWDELTPTEQNLVFDDQFGSSTGEPWAGTMSTGLRKDQAWGFRTLLNSILSALGESRETYLSQLSDEGCASLISECLTGLSFADRISEYERGQTSGVTRLSDSDLDYISDHGRKDRFFKNAQRMYASLESGLDGEYPQIEDEKDVEPDLLHLAAKTLFRTDSLSNLPFNELRSVTLLLDRADSSEHKRYLSLLAGLLIAIVSVLSFYFYQDNGSEEWFMGALFFAVALYQFILHYRDRNKFFERAISKAETLIELTQFVFVRDANYGLTAVHTSAVQSEWRTANVNRLANYGDYTKLSRFKGVHVAAEEFREKYEKERYSILNPK